LYGIEPMLPNWLHWMLVLPDRIPWLMSHPHIHGLVSSLLGAIIAGGTVWAVRIVGNWVFQREAMGDGDIYLLAMIGAFVGWQPSLIVFFLVAPLCALVFTAATFSLQFSRPIPFGPYLSAGALLVILFWRPWFSKFETFFSRGPLLPIVFALMAMMFVPLLVLIRFLKRKLGFRDGPDYFEEWTSGDQLTFYANKEERQSRGSLSNNTWSGIPSGQGTLHADRWRGSR
jgi:leader peptidase (prepilin peptidase)/N-methyltransferase